MTKKTRIIALAALGVLAAAALYLNFMPRRAATTNDDALNAANTLVNQQGGGEQPKNAEGIPLDAVVDPNRKPGSATFGK